MTPLPEIASEVTPDLSDVGVQLSAVAPRINPIGPTSSLRNMAPPSTGGGMALGPGVGAGGGQLGLQGVGAALDVGEDVGTDEVAEGEELFTQAGAHGRLVVGGLVEGEWLAAQADGSVRRLQPGARPVEGVGVAAEGGHDEQMWRGKAGVHR